MNTNVCFIAVGKTSDTTVSAGEFKRYIGVGTVKVLAVNPKASQIESIMGFKPQSEPVYTGVDANGHKTARITFIVGTVPEKCNGIDAKAFLSFNLTAVAVKGATSGKVQVIDDFGSAPAWGEEEVVNASKPIIYSDGRNPLLGAYHKVCRGEVGLVSFLRAYLGIPNATTYENNMFVPKKDEALKEAQLKLESIANYFKGDFSEIKEAVGLMPDNEVKVLFGVRTNDEGKQFQDVNSEVFMSARSKSTKQMEKYITDAKANNRYANTEYEFTDIHEYNPQPTNFEAPKDDDDLPFTAQEDSVPWS